MGPCRVVTLSPCMDVRGVQCASPVLRSVLPASDVTDHAGGGAHGRASICTCATGRATFGLARLDETVGLLGAAPAAATAVRVTGASNGPTRANQIGECTRHGDADPLRRAQTAIWKVAGDGG